MSTLERIARYGAILGFLFVSSGCVIAPDHDRDRDGDRYHDRYHDRDREARDHDERHCDEHDRDDRCRDR
jgi:hypothetical protein